MPKNNGEYLALPRRGIDRAFNERMADLNRDERIEGPQYHVYDYGRYDLVRPSMLYRTIWEKRND